MGKNEKLIFLEQAREPSSFLMPLPSIPFSPLMPLNGEKGISQETDSLLPSKESLSGTTKRNFLPVFPRKYFYMNITKTFLYCLFNKYREL